MNDNIRLNLKKEIEMKKKAIINAIHKTKELLEA